LKERLKALVSKWRAEQADFKAELPEGIAAAAIRLCADELEAALAASGTKPTCDGSCSWGAPHGGPCDYCTASADRRHWYSMDRCSRCGIWVPWKRGPQPNRTILEKEASGADNAVDLDAIEARVSAANEIVRRLCLRRDDPESQEWIMHIPAEPKRDPDLVISASLHDVPTLIAALRAKPALADNAPSDFDALADKLDCLARMCDGEEVLFKPAGGPWIQQMRDAAIALRSKASVRPNLSALKALSDDLRWRNVHYSLDTWMLKCSIADQIDAVLAPFNAEALPIDERSCGCVNMKRAVIYDTRNCDEHKSKALIGPDPESEAPGETTRPATCGKCGAELPHSDVAMFIGHPEAFGSMPVALEPEATRPADLHR
jgi:hypothetical protein